MRKIISVITVIILLIALAVSFIAGQIYEAKQRLKHDLQYTRRMYRHVENGDMESLIGSIETSLMAKSAAMQSALKTPFLLYLHNCSHRAVASDEVMYELIGAIDDMKLSFTNRMQYTSPPWPSRALSNTNDPTRIGRESEPKEP